MTLVQSTNEAAAAAVALRNSILRMHSQAIAENPPLGPTVSNLYTRADDVMRELQLLAGLMGPEPETDANKKELANTLAKH